MIDAIKFRELVEAWRIESKQSMAVIEYNQLSDFLFSHADALLNLVETTDMLKSFMEIGEQP